MKNIKIFFSFHTPFFEGPIFDCFVKQIICKQKMLQVIKNFYAFFFCRILEVKLDRV